MNTPISQETGTETSGLSPPHIMIVDDEIAQMRALCDTLREQGYQTTGFASGEFALAALQNARFDLLLSDLMMPEMDGITLLQAALVIDPNLVGIIMTGEGTISTAVEAMKVGAFDYILKPFKLSAILPVLSRALAIKQLRMENAALERDLREHATKLEAANRELEAFSYSVSHDLRAPLRAITGFSRILIEDHEQEFSVETKRLLDNVISGASRMEQLISDLLEFSRLSREPLTKQVVSISSLVQEVLRELNNQLYHRCVDIRVGDLPDMLGDPSLLKQVWINLISNAFKFTRVRELAIIEIGYQQLDGEHVYFIKDNGAGFDMRYAKKLFGVFQRMHSAEEFEGTGIGLSIVNRIIQRHGGRIWAESTLDVGTQFQFTLPD